MMTIVGVFRYSGQELAWEPAASKCIAGEAGSARAVRTKGALLGTETLVAGGLIDRQRGGDFGAGPRADGCLASVRRLLV